MRSINNPFLLIIFAIASISCAPVNDDLGSSDLESGITRLIIEPFASHTELQNNNLFLESDQQLTQFKKDYKNGKETALASIRFLEEYAELIENSEIPSVTTGKKINSATLNDYVSIGTYWWPNPETENGYPYIRIDGKQNPEVKDYNRDELNTFRVNLYVLSTLYYITNNNKYASKAIDYLNHWFVRKSTRMNPHMRFAQGIPGDSDGRFIGLIEGREFIYILDSIYLLKTSKYWNANIETNIYEWYLDFYKWYHSSTKGKIASSYTNNHATWYDLQLTAFAITVGKTETAFNVLDSVKIKRIETQIGTDGRQPEEIKRTKGLQYSALNLQALIALGRLGNEYNIDIWESDKYFDSSLVKAIDYIIPYLLKKNEWPHSQSEEYNACNFITSLNIAYEETGLTDFRNVAREIVALYNCEMNY